MFYHINVLKQTEKKKYQLDFAIEGDFDGIKERLAEKEIVTLSINEINEKKAIETGNIHVDIFHHKDESIHKLITKHNNIAQACLLLMFLGFSVQYITDTNKPLTKEKSDYLIQLVQQKIDEQKQQAQNTQNEKEQEKEKFASEKLKKLKEIAEQTQKDIDNITTQAQGSTSPTTIKELENIKGDIQKYARGTNANKISIALKKAFNLMESIELAMIDEKKEKEIIIIKDSMISNVDILNEYSKRQRVENIKKAGEKGTDSDYKHYEFLGKIGIYIRFLHKEFVHKIHTENYIIEALVHIINHISIILPSMYAAMIIRAETMGQDSTVSYLFGLSQIAVYALLRSVRSNIVKKHSIIRLLGMLLVVGAGYMINLVIHNTFAL